MKHFILAALIAGGLAALAYAPPAAAQVSRTWVSSTGDDNNPTCVREAPCKTFAAAYNKTTAGGEINCIDSSGFGGVNITKSIIIRCVGVEAGVLVAGSSAFSVNIAPSDVVWLEGLDIQALSGVGGMVNGITISSGGTLFISNCTIRGFRENSNSNGVRVIPASGLATVFINDSHIARNGNITSDAGILVRPTGGASANVSITNVKLESNTNGIFFDGSGGAGPSNINVFNSTLAGSQVNGIAVASSSAAVNAVVANSLLNLNANTGAAVAGSGATLRLDGNAIVSNVTGVFNSGGTLQSLKNNTILANGSDGTPIPAYPGPGGTPLQ